MSSDPAGLLKNKISELKSQYKDSLDKANRVISILERDKLSLLAEKDSIISSTENKIQALTKEKEYLDKEIRRKELENQDKIVKIEKFQEIINQSEPQIKELKNKLYQLEKLLDNKNQDLLNNKNKYNEELQKYKINLNKVTVVANRRKDLYESMKLESEQKDSEINSLKDSFNQDKIYFSETIDKSEKRNSTLENELKNRDLKLSDLEQINLNLKNELNLKNNSITDKETKIEELNNIKYNLENTIREINLEKNNNLTKLEQLEKDYKNTQKDLEISLSQNKELEIKEKELNNQLEIYSKLNRENSQKIQSFEQIKNEMERNLLIQKKAFQDINEINQELIEKFEDFEIKNKDLEKILHEKDLLIEHINLDKESIEEKLRKKNESVESDIKEIHESYALKIDIKERKINDLNKSFEDELKIKSKVMFEKEQLSETIQNKEIDIENLKNEINKYQIKVQEYKGISKDFESKLSDLTDDIYRVRVSNEKDLKVFIKEKEDLKLDLESLNIQIEKLKQSKKQEVERFDNEINSLISENSTIKVNSSKKEIELEVSKQEIDSLKKQIENLKKSSIKDGDESKKYIDDNEYLTEKLNQKEKLLRDNQEKINEYNSEVNILKAQLESTSNKLKIKLEEIDNLEDEYRKENESFKNRINNINSIKDNEIKSLYEEINILNQRIVKISESDNKQIEAIERGKDDLINQVISEKDAMIESLKNENKIIFDRLNNFKNNDTTEKMNKIILENKERNNQLISEIESFKNKSVNYENEIKQNNLIIKNLQNQNTINQSFELKNKELQEQIEVLNNQLVESEKKNINQVPIINEPIFNFKSQIENKETIETENVNDSISKLYEKINSQNTDFKIEKNYEADILNKFTKNENIVSDEINTHDSEKDEIKEPDLLSIDDLYKTSINNQNSKIENEDVDISRLEFYSDIIDDKKEPEIINKKIKSNNDIVKSLNAQLDKVQDSLSYLQADKKNKPKNNVLFIMGGSKDIEEKAKTDLEKCLQEYNLTHQWLNLNDKDSLKRDGKGVVFLISSHSLQLLESADQMSRLTAMSSIKHNYVNMTKLKLDIIDNFVRKK